MISCFVSPAPRATRSASTCPETTAAAPATRRSSMPSRMCLRPAARKARTLATESHGIDSDMSTDSGYIGKSGPRRNARRVLQGRGAFVDDLRLPRLAHVVFFRSPYAHALIKRLDFGKARGLPGVVAVVDGPTLAKYCKPWVAVLAHLKGIRSPAQHP